MGTATQIPSIPALLIGGTQGTDVDRVDYFRLDLDEGARLRVDSECTGGSTMNAIILRDDSDAEVAATACGSLAVFEPGAGTWYIVVQHSNGVLDPTGYEIDLDAL